MPKLLIKDKANTLVLFEEWGDSSVDIRFQIVAQKTVSGQVDEGHWHCHAKPNPFYKLEFNFVKFDLIVFVSNVVMNHMCWVARLKLLKLSLDWWVVVMFGCDSGLLVT